MEGWHWDDSKGGWLHPKMCARKLDGKKWSTFADTRST